MNNTRPEIEWREARNVVTLASEASFALTFGLSGNKYALSLRITELLPYRKLYFAAWLTGADFWFRGRLIFSLRGQTVAEIPYSWRYQSVAPYQWSGAAIQADFTALNVPSRSMGHGFSPFHVVRQELASANPVFPGTPDLAPDAITLCRPGSTGAYQYVTTILPRQLVLTADEVRMQNEESYIDTPTAGTEFAQDCFLACASAARAF